MKKKILWYAHVGDYSSFSRISHSILPELSKTFDITVLTSSKMVKDLVIQYNINNYKLVALGADTKSFTFDEFVYSWRQLRGTDVNNIGGLKNPLECHTKYIVIQIAELIDEFHYDYLVMCNGVCECNNFIKILKEANDEIVEIHKETGKVNGKRHQILQDTKLVIWAPVDFIPTYECVEYLFYSDFFFTMTPIMKTLLENLLKKSKENSKQNSKIDWIGHGTLIKNNETSNRKKLIMKANSLKIWEGLPLKNDDIIILNANNCVPRKRFDLTIKAFDELVSQSEYANRLRLWIHTDMNRFKEFLKTSPISNYPDKIIVSHNTVSDEELSLIYKVCQIGLQTSTGEGWSLTNCEHALHGGLQVVPDFLATRFHFKDLKGHYTMPVKVEKDTDGMGHDTLVGIPYDISQTLVKAVKDVVNDCEITPETVEYFNQFTWKSCAEKFQKMLE